jgi:hypothetical protein
MSAKVKAGSGGLRLVWVCMLPLFALAVGLAACATKQAGPSSGRPKSGLTEYREIVVVSLNAMEAALDSLDRLTIKPDRKSFEAFAESIHRIEVDSIKVRARFQAMESRGDAYFEEWREQLAEMTNAPSRQLAGERRDDLKRSFDQILHSTRQTRQAFDSFLAGLRHLRAKVEPDPGFDTVNSARALIVTTGRSGHQVQEGLVDMLAELNSISVRLAPPKAAQQP